MFRSIIAVAIVLLTVAGCATDYEEARTERPDMQVQLKANKCKTAYQYAPGLMLDPSMVKYSATTPGIQQHVRNCIARESVN